MLQDLKAKGKWTGNDGVSKQEVEEVEQSGETAPDADIEIPEQKHPESSEILNPPSTSSDAIGLLQVPSATATTSDAPLNPNKFSPNTEKRLLDALFP